MTEKRKTKNQFTKGHTKSKGFGRPTLTEAEKELSIKTRTQFKTMLDKYLVRELTDLKKLVKKTSIPAIDAMIIKSLIKTIESGDQTGINWFLNHSLGKEKETTNINLTGGMENTNSINLKNLTKEELLVLKQLSEKNGGK